MTEELRTVGHMADACGVSVRTLHHYDEIGLLVPSRRSTSGYRLYDDADVRRLALIVAYRAVGMPLDQIAEVLDGGMSAAQHLRRQLEALDEKQEQLLRQRAALEAALAAEESDVGMDADELIDALGGFDPSEFDAEVEERWGDTDAYAESKRRTSAYSRADWERITAEGEAIESSFAECLTSGMAPDSAHAKEVAERHRRHIDASFYPCSYDMQCALADMYVADERFTRHYDDRAPGLAAYVQDAIIANAVDRA